MSPQPSCRLHLVLARSAPIAAIIRRGPAKRVHIIRWDYSTDDFQYGSWFYGSFHEQVASLSPDGRWLYYFAANYNSGFIARRYGLPDKIADFWSAIGELPWLKAAWIQFQWDSYGANTRPMFVTPDDPEFAEARILDGFPEPFRLTNDYPFVPENLVADAQWSGKDLFGRTVYTRQGKLYRMAEADSEPQLIADFSGLTRRSNFEKPVESDEISELPSSPD